MEDLEYNHTGRHVRITFKEKVEQFFVKKNNIFSIPRYNQKTRTILNNVFESSKFVIVKKSVTDTKPGLPPEWNTKVS